jgi:hypothetical protein
MLETNAPHSKTLQRVCIRCGDANTMSLSQCSACGFDLTSDLQRDYDFYRDGVPLDAPTGVGERQAQRDAATVKRRSQTQPGVGNTAWQPYREQGLTADPSQPTSQATMDLGAAVLQAVFETAPPFTRGAQGVRTLAPLTLETPEPPSPDPVGWSPTTAMRVEPPVVVGVQPGVSEHDDGRERPRGAPHVIGAVHDWSVSAVAESLTPPPHPKVQDASRPIMASRTVTYAPAASPPYPTPASVAVTTPEIPSAQATAEALLAEPIVALEPVSRRNHIRQGATTYVDVVQGSARKSQTGWWPRHAALPLAIAIGLFTLVLFALM